jgi:SAM-dependent methyltransferase
MDPIKIKGLALKIYDTEMSEEERSDYWDKKMKDIYFAKPELFLHVISNTGIYSFINHYLPQDGLFLDGGCGSNYMAHLFDTASRKIIGLDFAMDNLIQGKKVYSKSLSVAGDLNDLPFADKSFDAILSISTAEHLETGPMKLFEETHRVLKSGGSFLFIIPTYHLEDMAYHLLEKIKKHPKEDLKTLFFTDRLKLYKAAQNMRIEERQGFFAYWFNRKTLKNMLREAGFAIEQSFSLGVFGGAVRSRLFGRFATTFLQKTFASLLNKPIGEKTGWVEKIFVKEDFYQNRFEFFVHELFGRFYRDSFAFVCRKN